MKGMWVLAITVAVLLASHALEGSGVVVKMRADGSGEYSTSRQKIPWGLARAASARRLRACLLGRPERRLSPQRGGVWPQGKMG